MSTEDRSGRTRLHYAALQNDADLVAGLIAGGADVNAADKQGYTPLHFACQQDALAAARLLLDAGATVDSIDALGNTPLFLAVGGASDGIIRLLREHGADPLVANRYGVTPVGLARSVADHDLAQYFEDVPDEPEASIARRSPRPTAPHRDGTPNTDGPPDPKWQEQYQRLWSELVPPRGQAPTVQGELVRCVGRLTDEAYRNGNQNWSAGSGHHRMLAYIERTLLGDATFDVNRQAAIRRDITEISDFEHLDTGGEGTCYYNLTEAVVDWCLQHPEPIPREQDADLNM